MVTEKEITVYGKLFDIAGKNSGVITGKVLAEELLQDVTLANMKEWDINGEKVTIGVEKI